MRRAPRHSMQIIRWAATFRETKRHAHMHGRRVCSDVLVASVDYWLTHKAQPRARCTQCRMRLARALQPTPAPLPSRVRRRGQT